MAYIKLATGEYPRYEGDIRNEHPEIGAEFKCPDTYAWVEWVDPPVIRPREDVREETAPEFVDGKWQRAWTKKTLLGKEREDYAKLMDAVDRGVPLAEAINIDKAEGSEPDVIG